MKWSESMLIIHVISMKLGLWILKILGLNEVYVYVKHDNMWLRWMQGEDKLLSMLSMTRVM